jgi:microcystin-dependent protein
VSYFASGSSGSSLPTGSVVAFAGSAAPVGWLLCDGTAKDRTTYAALFAILGTAYGVGDGGTTFNIPDLRGRVALGRAATGTGSVLGGTGGSADHTHTSSSTAQALSGSTGSNAHSHGGDTGSSGGHNHTAHSTNTNTTTGGTATRVSAGGHSIDGGHTHTLATTSESHSHTVSLSFTPSVTIASATGVFPPFQTVNYIIKT